MWKMIVFILSTILLVYVSRASLRKPRSHGFYRFFAWECMLVLFLLNVDFWFPNPFAWNEIIAWALLLACIVPLAFGVQSLRSHGKPTEIRIGDDSLPAFEQTTQLVSSGIYHFIRHPLYSSLLLLTWGMFFKSIAPAGIALATVAAFFLVFTAKADEAECVEFFGSAYSDYMKTTRMFIPYVYLFMTLEQEP